MPCRLAELLEAGLGEVGQRFIAVPEAERNRVLGIGAVPPAGMLPALGRLDWVCIRPLGASLLLLSLLCNLQAPGTMADL